MGIPPRPKLVASAGEAASAFMLKNVRGVVRRGQCTQGQDREEYTFVRRLFTQRLEFGQRSDRWHLSICRLHSSSRVRSSRLVREAALPGRSRRIDAVHNGSASEPVHSSVQIVEAQSTRSPERLLNRGRGAAGLCRSPAPTASPTDVCELRLRGKRRTNRLPVCDSGRCLVEPPVRRYGRARVLKRLLRNGCRSRRKSLCCRLRVAIIVVSAIDNEELRPVGRDIEGARP